MEVKKFEVGKTYSTRSACDYDCIFSWVVIARTAKQLTLKKSNSDKTFKRGVYVYDGVEYCRPQGTFSMCPVISAER